MDDLISRQAAIRFIRDKVSLSLFMKRSVDKADKACMELCDMLDKELPSAQQWIPPRRCIDCENFNKTQLLVPQAQQQKKGHWIKSHGKEFRCSECKHVSEYRYYYCHNCGEDMRGDTDG